MHISATFKLCLYACMNGGVNMNTDRVFTQEMAGKWTPYREDFLCSGEVGLSPSHLFSLWSHLPVSWLSPMNNKTQPQGRRLPRSLHHSLLNTSREVGGMLALQCRFPPETPNKIISGIVRHYLSNKCFDPCVTYASGAALDLPLDKCPSATCCSDPCGFSDLRQIEGFRLVSCWPLCGLDFTFLLRQHHPQ